MTTPATFKPSDLVIWRDTSPRTRRLLKLGTASIWRDRQTGKEFNLQANNWICKIRYEGVDLMDPEDHQWVLVTQGQHSGSRRYRSCLTEAEAERQALAWLDRRFKVLRDNG
jgi:hypothetical protein